jgi:hypothetical protein
MSPFDDICNPIEFGGIASEHEMALAVLAPGSGEAFETDTLHGNMDIGSLRC